MKKTNIAWCIAWIGGVIAANLIVTEMGPEYSIFTAFLFIGLSITSRDFLHDAWEWHGLRWKMPALIAVGGAVSYLIQQDAGRIALASVAAFIISESVDALVYHSMRKEGYYKRVNGSNTASSAIDSILFPMLAFGGFPIAIILGQFVAKVAGGAVWSWTLKNKRAVGVAQTTAVRFDISKP
jgi:queuosine precursor transporter